MLYIMNLNIPSTKNHENNPQNEKTKKKKKKQWSDKGGKASVNVDPFSFANNIKFEYMHIRMYEGGYMRNPWHHKFRHKF